MKTAPNALARRSLLLATILGLTLIIGVSTNAQTLDDTCTVSALNRTVQVDSEGVWVLPNVPADFGDIRIRATCVDENGVRSGSSELFSLPANGIVEVPEIDFDATAPIPERLELSLPVATFTAAGESAQLVVDAIYPDSSRADVAGSPATTLASTNSAVVSVDAQGSVAAVTSGTAIISAFHEGVLGLIQVSVVLSGDSDGDGLPDDWEIANGLDPNQPADAFLDLDGDGLEAFREFTLGTDPSNPDTDSDGLSDGVEVNDLGTNPLLRDTDGDQFGDGLEIDLGTDPLDPDSFDLAGAMAELRVDPSDLLLVVNVVTTESFRQLRAFATLIDGVEIDVTSARYGTQFSSSDLSIASFDAVNGRVFGGEAGVATVTATVGAFEASSTVTVNVFEPAPLSSLDLPGFANGIALLEDHALIASGSAGLLVVDVGDPQSPSLVAEEPTLGNANDVAIAGPLAALADGAAGLSLYDVSAPAQPLLLGTLATPGKATDVVLEGDRAFVVDEFGLRVIDISNPAAPIQLGSWESPGRARGVDVQAPYVVVADSRAGVHVIDITDPTSPALTASVQTRPNGSSSAAAVRIDGNHILVADGADGRLGGLRVIDWRIRDNPVVVGSTSNSFGLTGVAVSSGYVFTSDYFFVNGVPIFQISDDGQPSYRFNFDFSSFNDFNGNDLACRGELLFLLASSRIADNGVDAASSLFIGQWAAWPDDEGDNAPTVAFLEPQPGTEILERREIQILATASDDVRVLHVELAADGQLVGTDSRAPYSFRITAPSESGSLSLVATALDSAGRRTSTDPLEIQILEDRTPTVEILSPLDGSEITEGQIAVLAIHATDDHPEGIETELFVDGVLVTDTSRRYEYSVPLGASHFDVTARVRDELGQTAFAGPARVYVLPDAPPTVHVLQPADGSAHVKGRFVDVLVGAADDLEVAQVLVRLDDVEVATLYEAPFEIPVRMPADADTATLSAVAIDSEGRRSSQPDSITLALLSEVPSTQIIGRLVDEFSFAVAATVVTCAGSEAITSADGSFLVEDVPVDTADGTVSCHSGVSAIGERSSARSDVVEAIVGGVTDVGDLVLLPHRGYDFPGALVPMGTHRSALEVVDLDLDGFDDLVTTGTNCDDGDIVLRWGTELGRFSEPVSLGPCRFSRDLAALDADQDGHLDLVTVNAYGELNIYRGQGGRQFAPRVATAFGQNFYSMIVGDFDRDSVADLAVADRSGDAVRILVGNGDGTFVLAQSLLVGNANLMTSADYDDDGWADLVAANSSSYELFYFRGSSAGFASAGSISPYVQPRSLESMDADLDGIPDVVTSGRIDGLQQYRPGALLVLRPEGPAALNEQQRTIIGSLPGNLHAADFDGDGIEELVLHHDLQIASGPQSDGLAFTASAEGLVQIESFSFGNKSLDLDSGDADSDGTVDLFSINPQVSTTDTHDVMIIPGDGFGVPLAYAETTGLPEAGAWLVAAELDGDGIPDMVTAHDDRRLGVPQIDGLQVHFGIGDGTYLQGPFLPSNNPRRVVIADVDSDGDQDLVTAGFGTNSSTGLKIGGVYVWKGDGAGSFEGGAIDFVNAEIPREAHLADVDEDGILDLLGLSVDSDLSLVHLGRGDGTFAPQSATLQGQHTTIAAVDLDQDGFVDLLMPNLGSSTNPFIAFFPGQGDGQFPLRVEIPFYFSGPIEGFDGLRPLDKDDLQKSESTSLLMQLGDANSDGLPDLVVASGGVLAIRLGIGGGELGEVRLFATTKNASSLRATDLDRDGRLDVLVGGRDLAVHYGRGDGTFARAQRYSMTSSPFELSDVDRDGDRDIVLLHDTEGDEPPRLLVLPWLP